MTLDTSSYPLIYFGKLPSRGDFVRSRTHSNEINIIDHWVSEAVVNTEHSLARISCIKFSHIDTLSNQIITGVLVSSHDSSQRHYPLIGFSQMWLEKPKSWMNYLPIKSASIWKTIHQSLVVAKTQSNDIQATDLLNNCQISINENASTHYYDFINKITLDDIARLTGQNKAQFIEQLIATGLLFLPILTKGFNGLNKTICWPLTSDEESSINLATFWQDLLHGFYQPHELHLNTYLYKGLEQYQMALSFSEPSGQLLNELPVSMQDTINPDRWVMMDKCDWTHGYIDEDIGLSRFNKLLLQDALYLYDTRQLFKKVFLAQ